jgi:hypothetical protein
LLLSFRAVHDGMVVLVDLLHANFRHLRFPHSKIVCLLLFARVGRYCSDQVILERLLPLLLFGLEDQCAAVRYGTNALPVAGEFVLSSSMRFSLLT